MHKLRSLLATAALGTFMALPAQAASVSYLLDKSDLLPDGTPWLKVTISDGLDGAVDFSVQALEPLLALAGPNFGIYKFAFNAVPGVRVRPANLTDIPSPGWARGPNQPMGAFGTYDMRLRATSSRAPVSDLLTFSVTGVSLDSVLSYVDLALNSSEGPSLFAAGVRGLDLGGSCGPTSGITALRRSSRTGGCTTTRALFGGAQVVPAPPAAWLLATGVVALVARRRAARARD